MFAEESWRARNNEPENKSEKERSCYRKYPYLKIIEQKLLEKKNVTFKN